MQPSVANASHSCNFPQRCRGAHRAPDDILPTPESPSTKTSLLEGGGPPAGGGRSRRASRARRHSANSRFPSPKDLPLRGRGTAAAVEGVLAGDGRRRGAHCAPADILPTPDFPPPKTSLLEGGGPSADGGRSFPAVESVVGAHRAPVYPPFPHFRTFSPQFRNSVLE